jgi:hypothetical protein
MDSFEKARYADFLEENCFNIQQSQLLTEYRQMYLNRKNDSDFYHDDFAHDTAIELIHSGLFDKNDFANISGLYKWNATDVKTFITECEY